MAFVRVNPGDPIQAQNLDQVIDALSGAATKGQPIALTALNDAVNYAETIQNLEPTNSRALNVLKSDGTTLIKADVTGVTLGAPLNLPTGSVTSAAIANAGVANVDLGPDVARANLLTNGGLEIWQRGSGPYTALNGYTADRWQLNGSAGDTISVSRDTTNMDTGSACAAVSFTKGTGTTLLSQVFINDFLSLVGQTVSLSIRVRTSTANAVKAGIYNGSAWTYSTYHTGTGTYQTLMVAGITLAAGAQAGVQFDASCTAYIDNACLVVGSQPANYVPLHPADDLARCLRYYERWDWTPTNTYISAGFSFQTTQAMALVPITVRKPVIPTVTLSPYTTLSVTAGNFGVVTVTSAATTLQGLSVQIGVAVASGLTVGQGAMILSSSTPAYLTVEANP